jgi:O-antigen ligase
LISVAVSYFAVLYGLPLLLEALGRDPTFTGRTKLWAWAMDLNQSRRWFGSGYEAFWINENTGYFSEVFFWRQDPDGNNLPFGGPNHAHSGYVDIYLELGRLGIGGLAVTALSTLGLLARALKQNVECSFVLCVVFAFVIIYAAAEGAILQQSDDVWFLFVLFYLFTLKEVVLVRGAWPRSNYSAWAPIREKGVKPSAQIIRPELSRPGPAE